jgi:hypothetical protein
MLLLALTLHVFPFSFALFTLSVYHIFVALSF